MCVLCLQSDRAWYVCVVLAGAWYMCVLCLQSDTGPGTCVCVVLAV